LRSFINELQTAQQNNASQETIGTLFNRSGYILFDKGEQVTLTNGTTGIVVDHADGHYLIADPANPQITTAVGFLNIMQPDPAIAEVQAEVVKEMEENPAATSDVYVSEEDILTQKLEAAAQDLAAQDGDISIVRLADGREATVKQGNIVTNPDGSINTELSDETIVIKVADSTELQQISIDEVDAIVEQLATVEAVEMAKNNIEEQLTKRNLINSILEQNGVVDVILIGNIPGQIVEALADGTYAFNWVGEDNAIHTLPVTIDQVQEVLPPQTEPVAPEETDTTVSTTEETNVDEFEKIVPAEAIDTTNVDWDNISAQDYLNISVAAYGADETLKQSRTYYQRSAEKLQEANKRVEEQNEEINRLNAQFAELSGPAEATALRQQIREAEVEKARREAAVKQIEQQMAKYEYAVSELEKKSTPAEAVEFDELVEKKRDRYRATEGSRLSEQQATEIIETMQRNAELAPIIELTPENWRAEFGADGVVQTPIGEVKMGDHQYLKLAQRGRDGKLGMIKPTLTRPDVIIEEQSASKGERIAERNSSYVFVKAFTNADGTRDYMFTSVTILRDGKEVVVSNQEKETPRIKRLLKEGKLAYINKATLPSESTASAQGGQSTIPGGVLSSENKDTTTIPENQEKLEETSYMFGNNSGYIGRSMSRNAAEARAEGKYPKTDFKKVYHIPEATLQALIDAKVINDNEWHHTSAVGNRTTFYAWENLGAAEYYAEHKSEIDALVKDGKSLEEHITLFNEAIDRYFANETTAMQAEMEAERQRKAINKKYETAKDDYVSRYIDQVYVATNGVEVHRNNSRNRTEWIAYKDGERLSKRNGKELRNAAFSELEGLIANKLQNFEHWYAIADLLKETLGTEDVIIDEKPMREVLDYLLNEEGYQNGNGAFSMSTYAEEGRQKLVDYVNDRVDKGL
ncbi:MAG: hypothetical protein IIW50_04260, partial [Alistipes sp.]|nr:hypothetical protein [Alistipes sp.]